jgi:hypothetical protein
LQKTRKYDKFNIDQKTKTNLIFNIYKYMGAEVKNNESQDSKIKGMLADNKLTKAERK